jgi:hypothetical protein
MPNKTPAPKTTTQKGYGWDHQTHRSRLIARHVDGTLCWWCARKMFRDPARNWDGKPLHADHSKTLARHGVGRTNADRLLHDTCNKQRGDGTRDDQRPALTNRPPEELEVENAHLGELCYFPWPDPPDDGGG